MKLEEESRQRKGGVSKVKLAIGAASLFLFIVGIKRTFRMDDAAETAPEDAPEPRGR